MWSLDIEDDEGLPTLGGLFQFELVQRHGLNVDAETVPVGIDLLAGRSCLESGIRVPLNNLDVPYSEEEFFGVFVVDQLLEKIDKEHFQKIVLQHPRTFLAGFYGVQLLHHDVHGDIRCGKEYFPEISASCSEGDIGGGDLFQELVRHRLFKAHSA
jgi:hypothetical protein